MILKPIIIIIFFIFSVSCGMFVFILENDCLEPLQTYNDKSGTPSIILDDEGNEFARFQLDRRETVEISQIPDIAIKAFIAAEDHSFFSHFGISLKGICRSTLINLYKRRKIQGASTITQQVARLLFLSPSKTFLRKIKEVVLALQIERKFSKNQILELYLNNIYFGRGIYGVSAACQRFWGKSIKDVTLEEAAMLAAVAKSARLYSPLNSPEKAQQRRNVILQSMKNVKFINQEELEQTLRKPLSIQELIPGSPIRLYIQEWIRIWAEEKWGKDFLYRGGLKIKTTINLKNQEMAEIAFKNEIIKMREKMGNLANGGMIVLKTTTGEIKCIIGGIDFHQSQFNRAFQAYRQIGSSFKPILYALALKSGFDMNDVFVDEPMEIPQPNGKVWKPKNWTDDFEGPMTLLKALTFSNNIVTIKLMLNIGIEKLVDWIKLFGITSKLAPYDSSALGTTVATTVENAAAFNIFANNGVYVEPHLISWVRDHSGKKIWEHTRKQHRVLDSKTNSKMIKALSYRMKISKSRSTTGWFDSESIGKSGSTNEATTTWFVGSTPKFTTATYIGLDDNKPMGRHVFANRTAFPIWLNFYKSIKLSSKHFYLNPELKKTYIDWTTGKIYDKHYRCRNKNIVSILK
jgi:penicillin-binding protein 1A